MYSQEDLFRRFATYLPANFIFGLAFLGASWQILEPIRYLNPLVTLLLLTGPTIAASKKFTDICLYQVQSFSRIYICSFFGVETWHGRGAPFFLFLRSPSLEELCTYCNTTIRGKLCLPKNSRCFGDEQKLMALVSEKNVFA